MLLASGVTVTWAHHSLMEARGLSLAEAAKSIIFVATKHICCRDKNMLVATTKLCLSRQNVCCEKYLSSQTFCCDKHTFVAKKDVFDATRIILVAVPANDGGSIRCR